MPFFISKRTIRAVLLVCLLTVAAVVVQPVYAFDSAFLWVQIMEGASSEVDPTGIDLDGSENIYTAGYFSGTADFDPGPGTASLTSTGDAYIQKLDSDGNYIWAVGTEGPGGSRAWDITVDSAGNSVIIGDFNGTVDFDPGPGVFNLTSGFLDDLFILKLDSSGNFLWASAFTGFQLAAYKSAIDGAGNIYVTGFISGTVDFDPGPGTANLTSVGDHDIFVAKFDSDGNYVWAFSMGSIDPDSGSKVLIDGAGDVYVTGLFSNTVDFDPGPGTANLTSAGDSDIFLQKLDSDGNLIWVRAMGGSGSDWGRNLAVDGSGNVYLTGTFENTVDFDPGPGTINLTSNGSGDVFITRLDSLGNTDWAVSMGGASLDIVTGIEVDSSGNVYTSGDYFSSTDFDPGPGTFILTPVALYNDSFFSILDNSGNFVWAGSIGSPTVYYEGNYGMVLDSARNIYATGRFSETADFEPGPGTHPVTSISPVHHSGYVLKIRPTYDLVTSATCSGDDLAVTISAADAPVEVSGTGSGLPQNGVGLGTLTLPGPDSWMGVTVTEQGTYGNGEVLNLGDFDCPPLQTLTASATCNGDDLNITITAGNANFDISADDPAAANQAQNNLALGGPYTLVSSGGGGQWTNITITELGGDTETLNLSDMTCPPPAAASSGSGGSAPSAQASASCITIDVEADREVVAIGDPVKWTLAVRNSCTNTVDDVIVSGQLPGSLTPLDLTTSHGEISRPLPDFEVQLGTMQSQETVEMWIDSRVAAGAGLTLPEGAAGQSAGQTICLTGLVTGGSDTDCVTLFPDMLPSTGGEPVGQSQNWGWLAAAGILIIGLGGYTIRRRTA